MRKKEGFMNLLKKYKIAITVIGLMLLVIIALFMLIILGKFGADEDKKSSDAISSEKPIATNNIILKTDELTKKEIESAEGKGITKKSDITELGLTIYEVDEAENTTEEVLGRMEKKLNDKHPDKVKTKDEFAEIDYKLLPDDITPNDPYYANEWHLTKINSPAAWSTTSGSSSVVIAILDTGVDSTHPDLQAKIVPGWNIYDNSSDTRDVYGHGTRVAGIAGAVTDNGAGVAAVSWGSKIMPIRISDTRGYGFSSTVTSGLTWAADHGARVANVSYAMTKYSSVSLAAKYFMSKGGVVAIGSGNTGAIDSTPDSPYILTVGATGTNDAIAIYSTFGNSIDITAPGNGIYSTTRGGGYSSGSGTSYSTPVIAGVASLIISANPTLSATNVENVLKTTALDLGAAGWDQKYGWGRVDAAKAVALAISGNIAPPAQVADTTAPSAPSNLTATVANSSTISLLWNQSSDNIGVTGYQVYRNGTQIATPKLNNYADSNLSPTTTYNYTVKAVDAAGNISTVSNTATVTTPTLSVSILSGPTVVSKTASSATINWTTNVASTATISYGTSRSALNGTKQDANLATSHSVTITGLTKGTTYYYKVTATAENASLIDSIISSFKTSRK